MVTQNRSVEAPGSKAAHIRLRDGSIREKGTYGWIPDLPDHRDLLYSASVTWLKRSLPSLVDLRTTLKLPAPYDQGQLGSCTANAIAGAFEIDELIEKASDVTTPSRLFIYYFERVIEHSVSSDSGAQIRDGIKVVAKKGAPPESLWKYNISKFAQAPPAPAIAAAKLRKAVLYLRVIQDLNQMRMCLAEGFPFVFGFTVYSSFESQAVASSGIVPLPDQTESAIGGHAVLAVGYDDAKQQFIVRNSWGSEWGDAGYCYMPYAYLTSRMLANDFWTIRHTTDAPKK